ncbi:PucR family transcriptional regulator [Rothia nasimurium]|uniref:PucR family transcriptional regulator n=1 Tax=Rothia nasimurium TaxID=85336 RepID=UPI001F3C464C|nr:helix-turn-helix domain-containing protein [Rothia nasimurium]
MQKIPNISAGLGESQLIASKNLLVMDILTELLETIEECSTPPRQQLHADVSLLVDYYINAVTQQGTTPGNRAEAQQVAQALLPMTRQVGEAVLLLITGASSRAVKSRLLLDADGDGSPAPEACRHLEALGAAENTLNLSLHRALQASGQDRTESRRAVVAELLNLLTQEDKDARTARAGYAHRLGLSGQHLYRVCLGRSTNPAAWKQAVEKEYSTEAVPAFAGEADGQLIGLIPAATSNRIETVLKLCPDARVMLGQGVRFEDLHVSWAGAVAVARSVPVSSRPGRYDRPERSWRMAVPLVPLIGELIEEHLGATLLDLPDHGASLLECVWAYIENGLNYKQAAAQLYIHENTLRNRLAKFESIVGRDVSSIDLHFELLWLKLFRELQENDTSPALHHGN